MSAFAVLGLACLVAAPPEAKPKPKFTLGKDTTYITEPLDKDGYIDYETALNERLRGTITPETNAVVLLMQAIGPKPEGRELHADWWSWLGVKPPPAEGEYFVSLDEYRRKKNGVKEYDETEYEREQNRDTYVRCRPWPRKDFAIYADWLDSIERPLENVAKAALRPDFYGPMVHRPKADDRPSLMGAFQLWTSRIRVICQALCIRAMDKTERKDYEVLGRILRRRFEFRV